MDFLTRRSRMHAAVWLTTAMLLLGMPPAAHAQTQTQTQTQTQSRRQSQTPLYEPLQNEEYGYRLDPPSGWMLTDAADMQLLSFASPDGSAVVQIRVFDAEEDGENGEERFDGPESMLTELSESLQAELEGTANFAYAGRDALVADMSFTAQDTQMRGYALLFDDPVYPVIALGYTARDSYSTYHDFIVSFLDSLSLDGAGDGLPGPMSQFVAPFEYGSRGLSEVSAPAKLQLAGTEQEVRIDPVQADASQVVIEREARLLSAYAGDRAPRELQEIAWERFFRMVYRDSYARLSPAANAWRAAAREQEIPRARLPAVVLDWLQGFGYNRPGGVADFLNPLDTLADREGDCDSLVIMYAILLDQLGIDTIIMVSTVHGHALAGVDIAGDGARFPFGGREWLVAELTAPVDIGLIERGMADPADWMGFIPQRIY